VNALAAQPKPRPRFGGLRRDDLPDGSGRVRKHFSAILRRLNYLSLVIRTHERVEGVRHYQEDEFDALVFVLARVVGQELVDRWLVKFEITVPGWDPNKAEAE
jgi:hypothetical protein